MLTSKLGELTANSVSPQALQKRDHFPQQKRKRNTHHTHRFPRLWWVCASHKFAFYNVPSVACLFYMLAHVDAQSWLRTAHVQGAPHLVRKHSVAIQTQEENLLLHEVFHSANGSCLPHIIRVWPCTFSHAAKSEVWLLSILDNPSSGQTTGKDLPGGNGFKNPLKAFWKFTTRLLVNS